ncbi:MAG: hypothetical protein AB1847_16995 [bacterium]
MLKKLIKSGSILLGNTQYKTNIFMTTNIANQVSYSYEVIFDSYDRIIIDDDDLSRLAMKIHQVVPVAHRSRVVAKMDME